MNFPIDIQFDAMDCGASCLKMVAKHYGKKFTLNTLRKKCFIGREGVSLLGISDAAEDIGFKTLGGRLTLCTIIFNPLLSVNLSNFIIIIFIVNVLYS